MPYVSMNRDMKLNVRVDARARRRAAEKVKSGNRWEFVKGMYGNVYEVVDHERLRWYRQDRPVDGQGDLFDGFLPFMCDYCGQVVNEIKRVRYVGVYWYYCRPNLPSAKWLKSEVEVTFCKCLGCQNGPLPFPKSLIGYHLTELYQDGNLIFSQDRRK